MSNLYVKWDGEITFGPSDQPTFDQLTNEEVVALGWYRLYTNYEHVSYPEITEYDDKVHIFVDYLYEFDDENNIVHEIKYIEFMDITFLKKIISSRINQYRDEYIGNTVDYGGVTFDTDEKSRENLTGALSAVSTQILLSQTNPAYAPNPIPWTINTNESIIMQPEEIINLALSLAKFVSTCYGLARYHKDTVLALESPKDVVEYDYSILWPNSDLGGVLTALS